MRKRFSPEFVNRIDAVVTYQPLDIESMETKTYSAPISGTPLFQLDAELAVPAGAKINEVRDSLEELQREQNIDIELRLI